MEALKQAPIEQQIGRVVKTVFRAAADIGKAVVMLPFSCGSVIFDNRRRNIHDHYDGSKRLAVGFFSEEDYDSEKHGPVSDWLEEGQRLPDNLNSTTGKTPIHRHSGKSSSGPHEYTYE